MDNTGIDLLGYDGTFKSRRNHRVVFRFITGCKLRHINGPACPWHGTGHFCHPVTTSTLARCLAAATGDSDFLPVINKTAADGAAIKLSEILNCGLIQEDFDIESDHDITIILGRDYIEN